MASKTKQLRLAFLVSGNGGLMRFVIEACRARRIPAEVSLVLSDRECGAVAQARECGIETHVVEAGAGEGSREVSVKMDAILRPHEIDLVCLSYNRLVFPPLLARFQGRMINTHPSLLPSFKGFTALEDTIHSGARVAGCTIHLCTEDPDGGPIIIQSAITTKPGMSPGDLGAMLFEYQRVNLCQVIQWFAEDRIREVNQKVSVLGARYGALPTNPACEIDLPAP
ncbi:MAG: hypothetical protein JW937_03630 [Candidatus Omnitrophica bacterium]|nr:hypothetical protein [Candidatus Omnitrophota bacterium]